MRTRPLRLGLALMGLLLWAGCDAPEVPPDESLVERLVITGQVTRGDGGPGAGVRMRALLRSYDGAWLIMCCEECGGRFCLGALTDANGRYTLTFTGGAGYLGGQVRVEAHQDFGVLEETCEGSQVIELTARRMEVEVNLIIECTPR